MNSSPLISIIVPVYNVEDFLPHCIDSILAQTYTNYEIIIVDDGSTDGSGLICDQYSSNHNQITVVHTENAGPSHARNTGLEIAKGDYISFIDSDDTIAPTYIETLYNLITAETADISMVTHDRFGSLKRKILAPDRLVIDGIEATKYMLYQKWLDSCVYCKLYRKQVFAGIRFQDGILYEDLEILARLLPVQKRIVWSNRQLYHYMPRTGSIVDKFSIDRMAVLDVTDKIVESAQTQYPELHQAALDRKLSANFNMLQILVKNGMVHSEYATRCIRNIKSLRFGRLLDRNVRLKNKLGITVSLLGDNALKFFCKAL